MQTAGSLHHFSDWFRSCFCRERPVIIVRGSAASKWICGRYAAV